MKKIYLLMMTFTIFCTSCISTYYQVYKVKPDNNINNEGNSLIYEDSCCKVTYNLWDESGNIGFAFYNKTDDDIYLNMEKSSFILNNISNQYYKNRVYTTTKNLGTTKNNSQVASEAATSSSYLDLNQGNKMPVANATYYTLSSGYSVSYTEEKRIYIPGKTAKIISEYSINTDLIRDCELFRYPTNKQIKTIFFTELSSPIIFSNRIVYTLGKSEKYRIFENKFYVSEITNYPENKMIEMRYDEFCGQKGTIQNRYFKNPSPDMFYIKYSKGTGFWMH